MAKDFDKVLVSIEGLTKTFPGDVVALENVSIDIARGEFTAILGENGAGKSTLVKILYGVYVADKGVIRIEGREVQIKNPIDAIKNGIVMVSQIPQLIDRLTVEENLSLSLARLGLLSSPRKLRKNIEEVSSKLKTKIDPTAKVWSLTYTQKQIVEIIRAVMLGAKLLILDEALTYLPLEERRKFYAYLKEFKEQGGAVVFTTHKIPEALEVADRIYVLRRGRLVGSLTREEATLDKVRELMFGEAAKQITYERFSEPYSVPPGRIIIEVKNLRALGDFEELAVRDVSLVVREGEIVGIAGVVGNGQRELLEAVVGLRPVSGGAIIIDGVEITRKGVSTTRELGVGFIPDQPLRYAASSENTVLENIAALFSRKNLIIRWNEMKSLTQKLIREFAIWPPREEAHVKLLSGGNIMKVVVSREITYARKALVAYNPTRGLDEVTATHVRRCIRNKAEKERVAVLFASEDLDEVLQLSDSVYVMNSGKLYGPFDPVKTPREEIEKFMVV